MKILHLTRHLEIGGIPRYVVDLSLGLQAKGHEVVVASTGGVQALQEAAVRHITIPLSSKFEFGPNLWRSWAGLIPVLRQEHFDIVHAHTRIAQVLAAMIGRANKIATVTTCHGFFKPNLGRRLWPCWGQKVIAISPAVQEHLIRIHRVPPERIICIPNGIDSSRYQIDGKSAQIQRLRARWKIPDEARIIGTTARLCPVKGLEYLLEGFASAARSDFQLYCLIVGDGPSRSALEAQAGTLGIRKRVIFTGAVQDVGPYLGCMDIFVLPSIMEGLGLSILEAFAAGKPVIASAVGGIVNVIQDGQNGLLIESKSPQAIAQSIRRLLTDSTLAQALVKAGRETVQKQFDLNRMVEQIEATYLRLN